MRRSFFAIPIFLFLTVEALTAQSYTTQQETLPCLNKKFTIVAHIFRDSLGGYGVTEDAIATAVADANQFFAPICASFEVCAFLYHDNFQHDDYGKSAEIIKLYHQDYRINMYFVSILPDFCGVCTGSVGSATNASIFIKKEGCVSSRTVAHELGHFFSLAHTFEGNGAENVDGSNCTTAGDQICDTPADPYLALAPLGLYVQDCRFINTQTDANGEYYNPDLGNIMSYYECDNCGFTWEQLNKMAQAYLNAGVKLW